ncbi:unnamed protein product [Prorocentrum cordatum]|uniref:Transmembrane 9 superfamily member n=1 Tax=Prorocentrum cordatum TaxID=2364126 RepID=A0ABN9V479_9DINO|nr:unnamed protein product [Polarella glacialis]
MGGMLSMGLMGMIMWGFLGSLFGFGGGLLYSACGAILFCGYIVFDTHRVMQVYGPDDAIVAAIELTWTSSTSSCTCSSYSPPCPGRTTEKVGGVAPTPRQRGLGARWPARPASGESPAATPPAFERRDREGGIGFGR